MSRTSIKPILEGWRKFLNESSVANSPDWWKREWNLFADHLRIDYPNLFFSGVISNYAKMAKYEGFEKYSHDFFIRILYLIQKNYPQEFMESIKGTSITVPLIPSNGIPFEVPVQKNVVNMSSEPPVEPKKVSRDKKASSLRSVDVPVDTTLASPAAKASDIKTKVKKNYNFDKDWWKNSLKIFMTKMQRDYPHMTKSGIVQNAMKQSEAEGVGRYLKYSHDFFVRMLQIIQSQFPDEYSVLRKAADIPADLFTIKRKPRANRENK